MENFQGSEILVLRFFLASSGIRQVCDGKTTWKKNSEIVGSFNGITSTCKLMTRFFFSQLRNNRSVSCLRNAIKCRYRVRGNFALVCLSFIAEMKSNEDIP